MNSMVKNGKTLANRSRPPGGRRASWSVKVILTDTELHRPKEQLAAAENVPPGSIGRSTRLDRYTRTGSSTLLRESPGGAYCSPFLQAGADHHRPQPIPANQAVIRVNEHGEEEETLRPRDPDIRELRSRLWKLHEAEGKTLAALNAALFASGIGWEKSRIKHRRGAAGQWLNG